MKTTPTVKQVIWSEMSEGELRYQLGAFERHNDVYGADYRQLVAECRSRGITERDNWQDAGEIRLGA